MAESPREVADRAKMVLVSLPSPDAARSVVSGLLPGTAMRYYIDLSTTGPRVAADLAHALGRQVWRTSTHPSVERPPAPRPAPLTIMVSGPPGAIERVMPILNELGSTIFTVGNEPGQGQMVKVINNLLSACSIAITAEAVALGVTAGLNPKTLLDVVAISSGSNTAVVDKFPKQVLTRRFDHGFRLRLMAKDVRLCLDEARERGVPMLLGGSVDELWGLAARQAQASDDCTTIVADVRALGRDDDRCRAGAGAADVTDTGDAYGVTCRSLCRARSATGGHLLRLVHLRRARRRASDDLLLLDSRAPGKPPIIVDSGFNPDWD